MLHFIPPEEVVRVLNAANVSFTLVGAHGLGGWTQKPQATEDVDVVVTARHIKKARPALTTAFPHLHVIDAPLVVRLKDGKRGPAAIRLLKPAPLLLRAALRNTRTVRSERQQYKVPSLEMALALIFDRLVSPYRDDADKIQDAAEFGQMVGNHPVINWHRLSALGDLVFFGGGSNLIATVRRVQAGEQILRLPAAKSPL